MSRPTISTCINSDELFSVKKELLLGSVGRVKELYEGRMQERLLKATQSCFQGFIIYFYFIFILFLFYFWFFLTIFFFFRSKISPWKKRSG